ncbi:putative phosphopantetheinyl transferase [Clostridium sp. CAG:710]|nr:putative phosphopantetheinyl transferase [Clostridium sp. CAG:710]
MQWQKIKNSLGTFYYSFSKTSKELLEIALREEKITSYKISESINGKPYIDNSNIFYNISHKNKMVGLIISDSEVGLDIEYIDTENIKRKSTLKYFFTEKERESITNNEELLTLWTKKESYIKLNGGMLRDAIGLDINNTNVIFDTFKLDNYIITICKSK